MPRAKRNKPEVNKFNMGVYRKLDSSDAKAYADSYETLNKKSIFSALKMALYKQSVMEARQKFPKQGILFSPAVKPDIKTWEDRNRANQNTKLNR
jgi:hypothetical protein